MAEEDEKGREKDYSSRKKWMGDMGTIPSRDLGSLELRIEEMLDSRMEALLLVLGELSPKIKAANIGPSKEEEQEGEEEEEEEQECAPTPFFVHPLPFILLDRLLPPSSSSPPSSLVLSPAPPSPSCSECSLL